MQKKLTLNLIKIIFHKYSIYIFLFLFSFFFNFYYGYRGVLPLDSFLIFDSGYFVLNGEYPFRDYWTITGPLLDYLQSIFFYILDVKWISYVVHASLFNFLIVLFSYFFFIRIGLNLFFSTLYSFGVAILAYPQIGTPFPDHHSFIFGVISMYFMLSAIQRDKINDYFFVTLFLFLSFLSKQIIAFYIGIFFTLIFLYNLIYIKKNNLKKTIYFLLGAFVPLLVFIVFLKSSGTNLINFVIQYILYPSTIGESRIIEMNLDFNTLIGQFKFLYICLIPAILIFFYNIILKKKKIIKKKEILIFLTFIGSILIFIYSQILTKNQIFIFSLIPMCLGFSHTYIQKYFNKKYLVYGIIFLFLFTTTKYHLRFNENKKFMELAEVNINKSINGERIEKSLSGLRWITHLYPDNPDNEVNLLAESLNIIKSDKKNKIIITDYLFFSALTENAFSSPNKWHDIRSVPSQKNEFYEHYKDFFFSKIKKNKIERIYFVGHYKEIFLTNLVNDQKCIKREEINEFLSSYELKGCKVF